MKGDYDSAIADYDEAIRMDPTSGAILLRKSAIEKKKQILMASSNPDREKIEKDALDYQIGGPEAAGPAPSDRSVENILNPLNWKPEHRAGLMLACAAGAAIGLVSGYATSGLRRWSLIDWLSSYSSDAFAYAVIGAFVVGTVVYCCRMFSN
jgi:hypothetical protein